jgi:hypothetical protein
MLFTRIAAIFTVFCLLPLPSLRARQEQPKSVDPLAPLAVFLGEWNCAGKFESNGKAIEARQSFRTDLDGKWILFRHDDKPPFVYHALAEWGWDKDRAEFVMFVQDSFGGVRKFHSTGLQANQLVWNGDVFRAPSPEGERFTFEPLDASHFRVSYFVLRNDAWKLVDASTCSK